MRLFVQRMYLNKADFEEKIDSQFNKATMKGYFLLEITVQE